MTPAMGHSEQMRDQVDGERLLLRAALTYATGVVIATLILGALVGGIGYLAWLALSAFGRLVSETG